MRITDLLAPYHQERYQDQRPVIFHSSSISYTSDFIASLCDVDVLPSLSQLPNKLEACKGLVLTSSVLKADDS